MFPSVKVSRRTPAPDPGERQHALARLKAASLTPVRRESSGPPGWVAQGPVEPAVNEEGRDELVVGLGWALWSLLHARPEPVPDAQPAAGIVSGSPVAQPSGQPTPGSTPSASSQVLVIDVEGKVRRPGLVRVKAGSRVADVLSAAGGALPGVDLTGLNLARQVADGEQILVGVPGGAPVGTPTGPVSPGGPAAGGQVDLNTATLAQLEDLPGVGPVLAQRIIDWRTEHGRFTSVDELQEVSGVGEKKFESLKPHVRV
jgi:competence protein ComEA